MANKFFSLMLIFALIAVPSFAANTHMVSYRIDPASPRQGQDFTVYATFKNDYEYPADNFSAVFACPQGMSCPGEIRASLPSYGMQEFAVPVSSSAASGIYMINVSWRDGSYRLHYDNEKGAAVSDEKTFFASIPIQIRDYSFAVSNSSAELYTSEQNNLSLSIFARGLHNAQISLYSRCMSFGTPLFFYRSIDGNTEISTPVRVDCGSGNSEIALTLTSDEMSFSIPLSVHVLSRPHADVRVAAYPAKYSTGKDYMRLRITNNGSKAEGLTITAVHSPAVNSPDAAYLGDFTGSSDTLLRIESDNAGQYPVDIEARWMEGGEKFSQIFHETVTIEEKPSSFLPIAVILCLLVLYLVLRK